MQVCAAFHFNGKGTGRSKQTISERLNGESKEVGRSSLMFHVLSLWQKVGWFETVVIGLKIIIKNDWFVHWSLI